jgi:hypothetical protein
VTDLELEELKKLRITEEESTKLVREFTIPMYGNNLEILVICKECAGAGEYPDVPVKHEDGCKADSASYIIKTVERFRDEARITC